MCTPILVPIGEDVTLLHQSNREKQFRKEFPRLGELRGFFPMEVNMMAMTATATRSSQKQISHTLVRNAQAQHGS